MAGCPSKECHDNLAEVKEAVFDSKDGLRSKVSKAVLWTVIVVLGIPFFATGIRVWFGTETAAMRFADVQAVSALRERVSVQETQFKALCESLAEIKATLNEVRHDVKALEKP